MSRGLAFTVIAVLVATSCSSPSKPASNTLLDSPGSSYHLSGASGPLTQRALAFATALPHDTMAAYVASARFRSASERVWTSHDDGFVTDVVVEVGDERSARRLVDVAGATLPGPATRAFDVGVDDGRGFVQTSDVHGQTMFCVIAFMSAGARAFVVTRCTPYPQDTTTVTRLARDQLTRATAG
jgi:hypothetical protein